MKLRHTSRISFIIIILALMAFSQGATPRYKVVREWMSDAYLQIRPTFYTYDEQGRLIRSESQNPDTFIITNTYTSASIISVTRISTSPRKDTLIYTLNAEGLISGDNHANTYIYNSDRKLIKGALDERYTWENGDMVTRTYSDGEKTRIVSYIYTDIPDMREYGDAPWGFRSAHLLLSEAEADPPRTVIHRYTFDDQHRVILDSAGADIYHYFY